MRIVVISDSHRRSGNIKILDAQQSARHIFFLGDVTGDIEDVIRLYPDKTFHIVSGNCDFFFISILRHSEYSRARDIFTHGHTLGVKYGTERLVSAARRRLRYCALRAYPCFKGII